MYHYLAVKISKIIQNVLEHQINEITVLKTKDYREKINVPWYIDSDVQQFLEKLDLKVTLVFYIFLLTVFLQLMG